MPEKRLKAILIAIMTRRPNIEQITVVDGPCYWYRLKHADRSGLRLTVTMQQLQGLVSNA